jgi:hypothetical protein
MNNAKRTRTTVNPRTIETRGTIRNKIFDFHTNQSLRFYTETFKDHRPYTSISEAIENGSHTSRENAAYIRFDYDHTMRVGDDFYPKDPADHTGSVPEMYRPNSSFLLWYDRPTNYGKDYVLHMDKFDYHAKLSDIRMGAIFHKYTRNGSFLVPIFEKDMYLPEDMRIEGLYWQSLGLDKLGIDNPAKRSVPSRVFPLEYGRYTNDSDPESEEETDGTQSSGTKILFKSVHVTNTRLTIITRVRMTSYYFINLFQNLTRFGNVIIEDDNPILATYITSWALHIGPWVKMQDKIWVRQQRTVSPYFSPMGSEQYIAWSVICAGAVGRTFTGIWTAARWFQFDSFKDDIVLNAQRFVYDLKTLRDRGKMEWYDRMKSTFNVALDVPATPAYEERMITTPEYCQNFDSNAIVEDFISWAEMKTSCDGLYTHIYKETETGHVFLLRLTSLEHIIPATKDGMDTINSEQISNTKKGEIVIDYFESVKPVDDPGKKVKPASGKDFIMDVCKTLKSQNVQVWVKTVHYTVEAAAFWEALEFEQYVMLSESAKKTISEIKKKEVLKYMNEYFFSILKGVPLSSLRKDTTLAVSQAIKKATELEVTKGSFIKSRFIGPSCEISCHLSDNENEDHRIVHHSFNADKFLSTIKL